MVELGAVEPGPQLVPISSEGPSAISLVAVAAGISRGPTHLTDVIGVHVTHAAIFLYWACFGHTPVNHRFRVRGDERRQRAVLLFRGGVFDDEATWERYPPVKPA